jgi:quinol monooxygenase YgiN
MLDVFVHLRCRAGNDDQVIAALATVVSASRGEAGCVSIDAFRSTRDPQRFFIHSVWRDAAAFDRHATLPHTVAFIETVDSLLDEPRAVHRTHRLT